MSIIFRDTRVEFTNLKDKDGNVVFVDYESGFDLNKLSVTAASAKDSAERFKKQFQK